MKEQEIASLQHKLSVIETDLENAESKLSEAKVGKEEGESHKSNVDILQRRIDMLEEQLDASDKNLKDTTEQCVFMTNAIDSGRWMCVQSNWSARSRVPSRSATSGNRSMRRPTRSTRLRSASSMRSCSRWRAYNPPVVHVWWSPSRCTPLVHGPHSPFLRPRAYTTWFCAWSSRAIWRTLRLRALVGHEPTYS